MQILKPKKERQGDFDNRFVPAKHQQEISLDKIVENSKANRLAAKSHSFDEWKDGDGSVFSTYTELLSYQTDKFTKRYPPNFATPIRPELVLVRDKQISWNKEALLLLRKQPDQWLGFKNKIDALILQQAGYDYENEYRNNTDRDEAIKSYLDSFAIKLNNLISENNKEN